MNTPISPELKSKIDDEAEKYGFRVPYDGTNKFYDESAVTGYIAGATAYAHYKERFDQAKKELEEQAAYLQKKIKSYAGLLPQVEERRLKATKEEDWYEEKECKVLLTVWGTNVKQWTETLTGIEALLSSWKEEGKEGGNG